MMVIPENQVAQVSKINFAALAGRATAQRACVAGVALLAAAVPYASACGASPPTTLRYACSDGRIVTAQYPDPARMLLAIDGRVLTLSLARSADGARYTGQGWQWWSKGMHDATLARLARGEEIASNPATVCHTAP
jgi:membrane-bound inhibitor of C-type lysozyme